MRVYRERLGVPISWWLLTAFCVALFGTTLWAGLPTFGVVAGFVLLAAAGAALLINWGRVSVEVTIGELRAGSRRLDLARAGQIAALDDKQTRAMRGPNADPAACLLLRPYLTKAVYIEIAGRPAAEPYWLVASRHPADLAAAIEEARIGVDPEGASQEDAVVPTSGKDQDAR